MRYPPCGVATEAATASKRAHVLLADRIRVECKSNRRLIGYSVLVHIGDTRFNLSCHCSDLVQSGLSVELGCFSAAVGIGGHSIGSSRYLVGSLSGHGGLIGLGKSCLGSLVDCIKTLGLLHLRSEEHTSELQSR